MAIAINTQSDITLLSAASITATHTVGTSLTDRLLLVQVGFNSSSTVRNITSVVWDAAGVNEALTEIDRFNDNDDALVYSFFLIAPTAGASKLITVNFNAEPEGSCSIVAYTLTGVDQDYPIRHYGGQAFSSDETITVNLVTLSGDFIAGHANLELPGETASWATSSITMTEDQDEDGPDAPNSRFTAAHGTATGTSTITEVVFTDTDHIAGMSVAIATEGTGTPPPTCPLGEGLSRRTGTNENISTFGAAGQGRDYTSIAAWESDSDVDLVTLEQSSVLELYDDAATFDTTFNLSGAITNGSYFRIMRPATGEGHDGTPNNGVHIRNTADSETSEIDENYSQIQGLIISQNAPTGTNTTLLCRLDDTGETNRKLIGCIFAEASNLSGNSRMVSIRGDADVAVNCLFQNSDVYGLDFDLPSGKAYALNCVAVTNGSDGFRHGGSADTDLLKNCLADGNGNNDFDTAFGTGSSHNASGDASAPGTSSRINQTFTFENAGIDDFHLDVTDAGARNFGTDLSEFAPFCFTDDIDGDLFTTWDIGFDEPESTTDRDFASTANIVFSTASDANAQRELASTANIVFSTSSDILEIANFTSQADVVFSTSSDMQREILITSQADIVFSTTSDAQAEREFASQSDVVFNTASDANAQRQFVSTASIVFSTASDANAERELASTANVVFNTSSDIQEVANFASQADVVFSTASDVKKTNQFLSQIDIVFALNSDANAEREFTSQADVVFDTSSDIDVENTFTSTANIVFSTTSDANAEREFKVRAYIADWLEVDPGGDINITLTGTGISWSNLDFATDSYVYKPIPQTTGDFEFTCMWDIGSATADLTSLYPGLSSVPGSLNDIITALGRLQGFQQQVLSGVPYVRAYAVHSSGVDQGTPIALSFLVDYWMKVNRTGSALTLNVYSDRAMTVLVGTSTIASLTEVSTLNYLQGLSTFGSGATKLTYGGADQFTLDGVNIVGFNTESNANQTMSFAVQADLIFNTVSDIQGTRNFASQADVVFTSQSDANTERHFSSTANIVFTDNTPTLEADNWKLADSYTINTGSYVSGDVEDTWTEDSTSLLLDEVVGAPGFDLEFDFGLVPTRYDSAGEILSIYIRYVYNGSVGHNIKLKAWNYNTLAWDNVTAATNDFPQVAGISDVVTFIFDGGGNLQNYLDNRILLLKIEHVSPGNITHDFGVEFLKIDAGHFHSTANIVTSTTSDANAQREFASQGDIVFAIASDINQTIDFTSQADVVFDTASDAQTERQFTSQADVVFDTSSDIDVENLFTSQADIVFDTASDIQEVANFTSTANVVFSTNTPGHQQERQFDSTANVVFDTTSHIQEVANFTSTAAIVFATASDIRTEREFASQADVVFSTTSDANAEREIATSPFIIFSLTSHGQAEREFASQADVVFDTASDAFAEHLYNSQSDIVFSTTSDAQAEREFASQSDVVFSTSSDISKTIDFDVTAAIVFSTQSDAKRQILITSQADIIFSIASDILQVRHFTSTANVVFDTTSDAQAEREFGSQSDPAFATSSDINRLIDFDSTANVVFATNTPVLSKGKEFASQADIVFNTVSDAHREVVFDSAPLVIFNVDSDINNQKTFVSHADDIEFEVNSKMRTERQFGVQADVKFDAEGDAILQKMYFASQADIVFDTVSDIDQGREFASNPVISIVINTPEWNAENLFTSQVDIVFDTSSNLSEEGNFFIVANIVFDTVSDANQEREFASQSDVVFNINDVIIYQKFDFLIEADIVFDTSSRIQTDMDFASQADIVFNTPDSHAQLWIWFSSTADQIQFVTSDPELFTEREFGVQADVVFDAVTDGNADRVFASTGIIEIWLPMPEFRVEQRFVSQADVVFDTISDTGMGRAFVSQADIIFSTVADGNAEREIGSQPLVEFDVVSDANQERIISTQTDIVFDLESLMRREILITSQADVVFETNEPGYQRQILISPQADIVFETNDPTWNVENPFVINRFQIDEIIVTNTESDIHNNISFNSQADIQFNINNFRLLNQRNMGSTVNIIIGVNNIDSLQNLTLKDLQNPRVRLLTPDQSTTLVSVG